jgi:hypothetical protein
MTLAAESAAAASQQLRAADQRRSYGGALVGLCCAVAAFLTRRDVLGILDDNLLLSLFYIVACALGSVAFVAAFWPNFRAQPTGWIEAAAASVAAADLAARGGFVVARALPGLRRPRAAPDCRTAARRSRFRGRFDRKYKQISGSRFLWSKRSFWLIRGSVVLRTTYK